MNRISKRKIEVVEESQNNNQSAIAKCSVCGKRFKSRSHFDAICNVCWADNEMRPYVALRSVKGAGFVN